MPKINVKNILTEINTINKDRIKMLIKDIEDYKIVGIEVEFDRTEREIVLLALRLMLCYSMLADPKISMTIDY